MKIPFFPMSCTAFIGVGGVVVAAEFGLKPDHPKLPEVEWVVHDGTRPQPRIVETAGAVVVRPPSDAKVLFGGENTEPWNGEWRVENGILIASPGNLTTKESFGAIQLHLEWRVPAGRKVEGQQGGNSGIFLMDMYEVQILQSHGNTTYPDGQAGALYGQYPPLVNATAPQGDWQSYDVTFVPPVYGEAGSGMKSPARVTVIHNGVMVQNDQAFLGPTRHKQLASYPDTHPATGPLRLQWHKDPIEFRNIWIRELGERDAVAE